jgi:hypothetical protein
VVQAIVCPEQQNASPNDRKTLVYQLGERGLSELIRRDIVPRKHSPKSERSLSKPNRAFAFAEHRSNSYYHEMIVDLGYFAPLHHFIRSNPDFRLLDFVQLMQHPNVPQKTRDAQDPLLIQLKETRLRFDGTPHLLIRKHSHEPTLTIGIPGIQVDRGTESFRQVANHLLSAIEFMESRLFESHWGFDNCVIPFLFTSDVRMQRAMEFVRQERGRCMFLLFQSVPDHLGHRLDGDVFGLEAIGSYIIWELEDPAGAKPYLEASTANSCFEATLDPLAIAVFEV